MIFKSQKVELWEMTNDPLILIERCGRLCYKSEPKDICSVCGANYTRGCKGCAAMAEEFVLTKIKMGHESIVEHASATFYVVTDRGMTHEIVRHRIASYSQESTRFCNYGRKDGQISIINEYPFHPESDYGPLSDEQEDAFMEALRAIEKAYLMATDGDTKVAPQWARRILPIGLKTEIAITMNFRELRHAIALRFLGTTGKPHPQIVKLFSDVMSILKTTPAAPVFADLA